MGNEISTQEKIELALRVICSINDKYIPDKAKKDLIVETSADIILNELNKLQ